VNATTGTAKLSNNKTYEHLDAYLARVRANTRKKFVVGFGIQTRTQLEWILERADGAVIGSAYLNAIKDAITPNDVAQRTAVFWETLKI
jgi:tryptophan synthase alpha chain